MSEITVERRPGGALLVSGLLAHPELVDAIAALLVAPDVVEAAARVSEYGTARMDAPEGSIEDALYQAAFNDLQGLLASVAARFAPRDLAPLADALAADESRRLVTA